MKKRILILVALMVVLLLVAGPVYAGPPTPIEAAGLWRYMPTIEGERFANNNTFLTTTEVGIWTGTFEGDSTEAGKVVIHSSGLAFFKAIVSFEEVEVGGKSGALKMSVVGKRPPESTNWEGKWVILSGTEGLATLRGQGTWWGPGYDPEDPLEYGNIWYLGNIHFDPQ